MKTVLIINAFCSRKVFESVERLWQDLGYKILDQNFNELLKYLMPSKMVNDNECTFLRTKFIIRETFSKEFLFSNFLLSQKTKNHF